MLFSSVIFLFYFMPIFFLLYYALPWRNGVLLLGSVVFYGWGEPGFVLLLAVYIVANYGFGRLIAACPGGRGRWLLALGVGLNLGLLLYFKYLGFLSANLSLLLAEGGWHLPRAAPVVLPLGISFFTFQGISYLIDIRRGVASAQTSLFRFAVYKSMFPQLIAGPIVRYTDVSACLEARVMTSWQVQLGIRRFILGLAQKVLIANTLAVPADQIFGLAPDALSWPAAWLGAVCYTLQIYFDFAGYSNMAIGLGRMMGFTYPANFNGPYRSRSITEFWRRWHMTLSRWFRDYLYIPLGGNRRGPWRVYGNLFVVFIVCGAWHGPSWTFIAWGFYHGLFLAVERAGLSRLLRRAGSPAAHGYTMLVVMIGWILFRADSLDQAATHIAALFGAGPAASTAIVLSRFVTPTVALAIAAGIGVAALPGPAGLRLRPEGPAGFVMEGAVVFGLLCLCAFSLAAGTYNPFIYFRF